jgi:hypothetical protein
VEELVPVVLVIIILVAWIVILGPSLIKRRARSGGNQSITPFHYQLRVLEHAAPEPIVSPAYRLRAVDGSGTPTGIAYADCTDRPVLTVVGAKELPRPALAFLGEPERSVAGEGVPSGPSTANRFDEPRVHAPRDDDNDWVPSTPSAEFGPPLRAGDGIARQEACRRRRDTLAVLAGILVTTVIMGLITGSTALWALGLVDGAALVAYVAVLVHLRRLAQERELKLRYLEVRTDSRPASGGGLPTYVSGRYAHPSNWHAEAR